MNVSVGAPGEFRIHLHNPILKVDDPHLLNTSLCIQSRFHLAVVVKRRVGNFYDKEYVFGVWRLRA